MNDELMFAASGIGGGGFECLLVDVWCCDFFCAVYGCISVVGYADEQDFRIALGSEIKR